MPITLNKPEWIRGIDLLARECSLCSQTHTHTHWKGKRLCTCQCWNTYTCAKSGNSGDVSYVAPDAWFNLWPKDIITWNADCCFFCWKSCSFSFTEEGSCSQIGFTAVATDSSRDPEGLLKMLSNCIVDSSRSNAFWYQLKGEGGLIWYKEALFKLCERFDWISVLVQHLVTFENSLLLQEATVFNVLVYKYSIYLYKC